MRRKTLAALIGVWLVAGGFLARRHEATVAHAVELRTGQLVHAERLIGHHEPGSVPDVHDRGPGHGDHDVCLDAVTLRTAAMATEVAPVIEGASPCSRLHEHCVRTGDRSCSHVYRLAPKTSPPAA